MSEQKEQQLKAEIESLRTLLQRTEEARAYVIINKEKALLEISRLEVALQQAEQERDKLISEVKHQVERNDQHRSVCDALREANTAMRKLLIEFAKPGNWGVEVNTYTNEWIGEGIPMEMATSILISIRERS